MFKNAFFIALAVIVGFVFGSFHTEKPKLVPKNPPSISAEKLMSVVNDWRYTQGFQPYTSNEKVCSLATVRVKQIQKNYSHTGFLEAARIHVPNAYVAENLMSGYAEEHITLNNWLKSPGHSKTLHDNYQYSCMKCENNFCVQEFANF